MSLLAKAEQIIALEQLAKAGRAPASPDPSRFRGFLEGGYVPGVYGWNRQREALLWDSLENDAELYSMVWKKVKRLPAWDIKEAGKGRASEDERERLVQFFEYPNGRDTFETVLMITFCRLVVVGRAYWRFIRRKESEERHRQLLTIYAEILHGTPLTKSQIRKVLYELEKARAESSPDEPIGFEWLQGQIDPVLDQYGNFRDPERAYIQTVGYGMKSQAFPAHDIIEFFRPNPRGGWQGTSEVRAVEKYSDASVWAFVNNREWMRGAARANKLLAFFGVGEDERARFNYEMLRRADVASADEFGIPLTIRFETKEGGDVKVVNIDDNPREMQFQEWDDNMRHKKADVLGTPPGLLSHHRDVNRSNMESQQEEFSQEVDYWSQNLIVPAINKRIIKEEFGIEGWKFHMEKVESRYSSQLHRDVLDDLARGLITYDEAVAKLYGKDRAEALPEYMKDKRVVIGLQVQLLEAVLNPPQQAPPPSFSEGGEVTPPGSPLPETEEGGGAFSFSQMELAKAKPKTTRQIIHEAEFQPQHHGQLDDEKRSEFADTEGEAREKKLRENDRTKRVGRALKALQAWEDESSQAGRVCACNAEIIQDIPEEICEFVETAEGELHKIFRKAKEMVRDLPEGEGRWVTLAGGRRIKIMTHASHPDVPDWAARRKEYWSPEAHERIYGYVRLGQAGHVVSNTAFGNWVEEQFDSLGKLMAKHLGLSEDVPLERTSESKGSTYNFKIDYKQDGYALELKAASVPRPNLPKPSLGKDEVKWKTDYARKRKLKLKTVSVVYNHDKKYIDVYEIDGARSVSCESMNYVGRVSGVKMPLKEKKGAEKK